MMKDNLDQSIQKVEENKQFLVPSVEKAYRQYFDKVTELQAGDIIVNSQCKLCNHPLRSEQTKGRGGVGSYISVLKFLNDHEKAEEYGNVKFNYPNLSVHINNHYEQQMKRIHMREYGRHLSDAINYKINKEEMFEGMIQALQLKLYETASNPDLDITKQCSIMNGLTKSILDASIVQAKLRGDIDTVEVYKEKVQNIMINFISDQDEDKRKDFLERLDIAKSTLQE